MKVSKYQNIKINLIFEIYGLQNNLHFNTEIQQNQHVDHNKNKYRVILCIIILSLLKEQYIFKDERESHQNNTLTKSLKDTFILIFILKNIFDVEENVL